jgi:4-hydroxy-3-methylbut-2-enyl diphosphate reductase
MNDKPPLIRKSMGFRKEVMPVLEETYSSSLIDRMKEQDFKLEADGLTILLAREFGFCYGVDRAIALAYEARKMFKDRRIFLTSEIIHNPQVNRKLRENGISFLSNPEWHAAGFDALKPDDIVIIPAFGTTTADLAKLQEKGCTLVDTTCGSVMNVWKRVESYAREDFTAIIHGKFDHEETRATSSRAALGASGAKPACRTGRDKLVPEVRSTSGAAEGATGKYLIVRDLNEAKVVCDFIAGQISKADFFRVFRTETMSSGFDPERDLARVGCANQTTMLSSESLRIADMIQEAVRERYGALELANHFRHFDTICSATQDRQDAIIKLVQSGIDLAIVIGGYNSSNTGHLVEIASEHCPAFHINDASEILSRAAIRHQPPFKRETVVTQDWLPPGKAVIGVTAGASTPNRVIEEVIERLLEITGQAIAAAP